MLENDKQKKDKSFSSNLRTGFSLPSGVNKKNVRFIYWGFVICFVGFLGTLAFLSESRPKNSNISLNSFYQLNEIYRTKGIERFKEEKYNLKSAITESLKNSENADTKHLAEAIALYLFPEILPDRHMEKEAGMALWIPLFQAIESKPGTPEARNLYEEAKTEIWNYENPDKKNPRLSEPAKETLKIYRELSAP